MNYEKMGGRRKGLAMIVQGKSRGKLFDEYPKRQADNFK